MSRADELREMQRKSWNKFSGGWKKWDDLVMAWLSETGDTIIDKAGLKDGDRVMDMSTGTGEPGLTAAGRVGSGEVIGLDLAEDMLAVANEKAKARGIDNYHTRIFNGLEVPFDDAYFNAVICRFGVIFSPEPESLLKEMVRVTQAGGRVSVSSWAVKEENPWATIAAGGVGKHVEMPQPSADAPGIFRYPDPEDLKSAMQGAGLKNVEITQVAGNNTFDSAQHYWEFMSQIAAPIVGALDTADDATKDKITASVLEAAGKFEKEGKVVLPWKSWVVAAEK